jgi:hypothetical protein
MANPIFQRLSEDFPAHFGLPQIAPPNGLEVIQHDNEAIEEVADSVARAEAMGELPRMTYSPVALTSGQLREGDLTEARR